MQSQNKTPLNTNLDKNHKLFLDIFKNDNTIIFRRFDNLHSKDLQFLGITINGMAAGITVYQSVMEPLIHLEMKPEEDPLKAAERVVTNIDLKLATTVEQVIDAVLYGDTAIIISGTDTALIADTKGFTIRIPGEPDEEKSLKGPREGFSESIIRNLAQIRRRLQTPDLKMEFMRAGSRSQTRICVVYLDSLCDKKVLTDLCNRLQNISIDGILDANYISELISDHRYAPFKTIGSSEKPDVISAKLLEGRIAVVVDGTPIVLTVPYLFLESFQSPDDYYLNFYYASVSRVLRILGFISSVSIPSVYVALVAYHPQMLPETFRYMIAEATKGVPFSTLFECIVMLFAFEMLREAGIRMSSKFGSALGVVGGLVVGQAAVDAKIVSAPVVVVVAITGLAALLAPRMSNAMIWMRIVSLLCTSILGIYGFLLFCTAILGYLLSLHSFSYDYVRLSTHPQKIKDSIIRAPWWRMITRPVFAKDTTRRKVK